MKHTCEATDIVSTVDRDEYKLLKESGFKQNQRLQKKKSLKKSSIKK